MLGNNKNFNHLKVHTQYSICEGAIKIDELADYCKSKISFAVFKSRLPVGSSARII